MEWYWILAALFGAILALMFVGFPVGIAFILVNTVAAFFLFGRFGDFDRNLEASVFQLTDNAFANMANFAIVPIPMFVLMGELFFHTGLANRMFNAVEKLMGRVPARLSYVTVAGGTAFATLSGSSMGSTALLGTLMVPEMTRRGYKKSMSIGPILGTGGLAMLIPPSALAVLLGTLAELDIGRLLVAGILPGLLLAALYAALIFVRAALDPDAAPAYDMGYVPWGARARLFLTDVVPMVSIIAMVILLIMSGVATPSESASFGVVGVCILAIAFRAFTWQSFKTSLVGAIRVVGMVFFILMNSTVFSQLLSMSGAGRGLTEWATGFEVAPLVVLSAMFLVLIVLGMFMDQVSMMLITVPIFYPIAHALGYDLIWFSLIVLMSLEMSATTPPFGLLLYIMMGMVRGTTLFEVASYAIPFLFCDLILIIILVLAPGIALYLPSLM